MKIKFVPFPKSLRKKIKWTAKLHIKRKGKGKKETEKKDRIRFAKKRDVQILAYAHVRNKKNAASLQFLFIRKIFP